MRVHTRHNALLVTVNRGHPAWLHAAALGGDGKRHPPAAMRTMDRRRRTRLLAHKGYEYEIVVGVDEVHGGGDVTRLMVEQSENVCEEGKEAGSARYALAGIQVVDQWAVFMAEVNVTTETVLWMGATRVRPLRLEIEVVTQRAVYAVDVNFGQDNTAVGLYYETKEHQNDVHGRLLVLENSIVRFETGASNTDSNTYDGKFTSCLDMFIQVRTFPSAAFRRTLLSVRFCAGRVKVAPRAVSLVPDTGRVGLEAAGWGRQGLSLTLCWIPSLMGFRRREYGDPLRVSSRVDPAGITRASEHDHRLFWLKGGRARVETRGGGLFLCSDSFANDSKQQSNRVCESMGWTKWKRRNEETRVGTDMYQGDFGGQKNAKRNPWTTRKV